MAPSAGSLRETDPLVCLKGVACSRISHRRPPRKVIQAALPLPDAPWNIAVSVADRMASLAEIVPFAHWLADGALRSVIRTAERAGKTLSCRKSCAACCNYLVPVSVPEAFFLRRQIASLPEGPREKIQVSMAETSRRIVDNPLPSAVLEASIAARLESIGQWYTSQHEACPLLSGQTCFFYASRPLACREHMVVSPPDQCLSTGAGEPEILPLPFSVTEALGRLAGEVEGTKVEAILLPLVLAWTMDHAQREKNLWPGQMLARRLLEIVAELSMEGKTSANRDENALAGCA
jgi:Fe-S-cluster containining protein